MRLDSIRLKNFRSYEDQTFDFTDDVTVVTGKNGTGKTNLLEAIYVLYAGKSFRDGDDDLVKHDEEWWRVDGVLDGRDRQLRYQPNQPRPKQLIVEGQSKGRFTYKNQLPVVLFEPDDLLMVHGTPGARRSYLDSLLVKLYPRHRLNLQKYERALSQRNNLLKKAVSPTSLKDQMFVWDVTLSDYGAKIQQERNNLLKDIGESLSDVYSGIADKIHTVKTAYVSETMGDSQKLAYMLNKSIDKDVQRGFTSVGPHRDDIEFTLDRHDAKQTASRGEVRSLILSLKHIEVKMIKEHIGVSPIVLMDDVFSELDKVRQKMVLKNIINGQKIITTTHIENGLHTTIEL